LRGAATYFFSESLLGLLEGGGEDGEEDDGELLELGGVVGVVGVVDDLPVLVEVSDRLVAEVPVLGRSHAARPIASIAGNATMRIRFTRFS